MNAPDPRFFESQGPVSLGALAELTGAVCDPALAARKVATAAVLARADGEGVTFFSDRKLAAAAQATSAAACFVAEKEAALLPAACARLVTPAPQAAWAMAAERLHRPLRLDPGAPQVHPSALLEDGVSVGHGAVIGAGAQVGAGTEIGPHVVIGPGVAIGRGCQIGAHASIGFALIGDRVKIAASVVIGESGFGLAVGPRGLIDVPQLGRVIIQDGVSIGAHTCIDRGAFDDTVVGENSKIDNLVQIAHNVVVGRNCAIAGHCGLSGSAVVGDGVQMGGRVGLADHVVIGAGARLAAAAGVMHDVPAGESWCGVPARPVRQFFREVAWLTRAASRKERGGEA
ncbi:MAG TPA: UDP-3-O-(3-hydroxymyristoyl)glucosamine N-acyltransferase [Caulobacteraceae bacterium]|nr:UDP-3-O-(3-hydroxymyristoyl)glucosamine N-acyltransferase [Caulobacteraceae bacterium]